MMRKYTLFLTIVFMSSILIGNEVFATHISKPVFTIDETAFEPGMIINISGWANYNDEPTSDVLLLVRIIDSNNEKIFEVFVTTGSSGNFLIPYLVPNDALGSYLIEATSFCREEHRNICTKQSEIFPITIQGIEPASKIPNWIRNNALWWSDGKISDTEFINGIQFLIDQKIIQISAQSQSTESTLPFVPNWIKDTAGWWATNKVSDDDFVNGIKWLIENGILKV